jgi:hypothetical protein
MNLRRFLLITLLALPGAVACGAPSGVDGEVEGEAFTVSDQQPELKRHERTGDTQIVLAEDDGDLLRTVVVFVESETNLEVGEPIAFGEGVSLMVSEGVSIDLGNGVINAKDPKFHGVVKGEIIFTSLGDPIVGEFWAELENGGYIEGTFVLDGSLR